MDLAIRTSGGRFPGQTGLDRAVLDLVVRHRVGWLTAIMRAMTELGGFWIIAPVVILGAVVWHRRVHDWFGSATLVVVAVAASVLTDSLKHAFARPRPPMSLRLVQAGGYAFPSGHSLQSAAVYGTLALLVASQLPKSRRWMAWLFGTGVAVLVGLSRVYLGVHWSTDVVAGWMVGAALVMVAGIVVRRRRQVGLDVPGPSAGDDPT